MLAFSRTLLLAAILMGGGSTIAEETRSVTDDRGREVEIPSNPQRIAALHDFSLTVPLLELGIEPAGSRGRVAADGSAFIRGGMILTGFDFSNSDIAFLGNSPVDIEALAAIEPDLILADHANDNEQQFSRIAPTLFIDDSIRGDYGVYEWLAELTGTQDRLEILQNRYDAQVAQLQRMVEMEGLTVNVLQGNSGEFLVQGTYGSLGKILRDAGFSFPALVDTIPAAETRRFSAETLPELDADVLFVTYRTDREETAADALSNLEAVIPGFCEHSRACRNGQVIFVPREEALAASYAALGANVYMVLGALTGREIIVE